MRSSVQARPQDISLGFSKSCQSYSNNFTKRASCLSSHVRQMSLRRVLGDLVSRNHACKEVCVGGGKMAFKVIVCLFIKLNPFLQDMPQKLKKWVPES